MSGKCRPTETKDHNWADCGYRKTGIGNRWRDVEQTPDYYGRESTRGDVKAPLSTVNSPASTSIGRGIVDISSSEASSSGFSSSSFLSAYFPSSFPSSSSFPLASSTLSSTSSLALLPSTSLHSHLQPSDGGISSQLLNGLAPLILLTVSRGSHLRRRRGGSKSDHGAKGRVLRCQTCPSRQVRFLRRGIFILQRASAPKSQQILNRELVRMIGIKSNAMEQVNERLIIEVVSPCLHGSHVRICPLIGVLVLLLFLDLVVDDSASHIRVGQNKQNGSENISFLVNA
ncbi:hypothetical protein PIB30_070464 [Stylosanthes scabra]|uniref:Uncharacterized protein n=1 Tax=Stylosanthes scabra TaxID=79078 RepID=A0ABU6TN49_9FABA|nr:hypothetical protein [Stylosanthes scabra]